MIIANEDQPCPTCKKEKFESFPNKGLQQPLYGFVVFCSNFEKGCEWEGELGLLDQHINFNPSREKQLIGCAYTNIACLFCNKYHWRHKTEWHQASKCPKRPFTCLTCEEYESTYEDVVKNHTSVCKCRLVACPNSCGAERLQYRHLEKHVSSQCPLTLVQCEFNDAGCDAKVHRKDLASHLTESLVTHMSLLAAENKKLKQQLEQQSKKFESETRFIRFALSRAVPIDLFCPANSKVWLSEPFYSLSGGYKLKLKLYLDMINMKASLFAIIMESEFQPKWAPTLQVTIVLIDERNNARNLVLHRRAVETEMVQGNDRDVIHVNFRSYIVENHLVFRVAEVNQI